MYRNWFLVSIISLGCLIPFMVPIKHKSHKLRNLRNILLVIFTVSTLITSTPQEAIDGAPFHPFGEAKIAFFACDYEVNSRGVKFCSGGWWESEKCVCSNPNARATMAYCYQYGHPGQVNSYLERCKSDYNISLTRQDFEEALTNYSKFAKPVSSVKDFHTDMIVDFPVKLEESEILVVKASYDQFLGNYDRSIFYGGYLVLYWIIVFAVVGLANWSKCLAPELHKKLTDPFTNWFRKNISLPASSGRNKTNEKSLLYFLDMLVPTRLESIFLTGFLALSLYLECANIHYIEGDPIFRSKSKALLRFYAVRSSILASSMMPFLILFGGRNNFLQWVTRWDYSTFITLHRWISRLVVVLVFLHAEFYISYTEDKEELKQELYIIYGSIGMLCGVVILIQGLLVLRRKYYETFLVLHIILAFGFIFGAYRHVEGLYCLWFYHFTFLVWIFDRLVRIGRLYSFGFPKAKVLLLADEALKVVIPKPEHWEVLPGGHVFIHFLRLSCFWQSHPFTYTTSVNNEDEIVIFVKVKEGVTKDLYNYLVTHPGKSTEIRVSLEGSYGEMTPASSYDSSLFLAGGNGIPGIYAEAYDLARKQEANNKKCSVSLVWVVREYCSLYWFYEELLSLKNMSVETTIYVTKPDSYRCLEEFNLRFPSKKSVPQELGMYGRNLDGVICSTSTSAPADYGTFAVSINSYEDIITKIKEELSFVTFKEGRPNIDQVVKTSIKNSIGSVAFVTCGHPVMVDDLRQVVVNNIDNDEKKRVDYYEQLQVWA